MAEVMILSTDDFDRTIAETDRVVVDFWAAWCQPCLKMAPVLEKMAEEQDVLRVAKVNTEENPELAARFDIRSIPALKVFVGGEEVETVIGFRPKKELKEALAKYLDPATKFVMDLGEFGLQDRQLDLLHASKVMANEASDLFLVDVPGGAGGRMVVSRSDDRFHVSYSSRESAPMVDWAWMGQGGGVTNVEEMVQDGGVMVRFRESGLAADLVQFHLDQMDGNDRQKLSDIEVTAALFHLARVNWLLTGQLAEQERRTMQQLFARIQQGGL